MIKDWFYIMFSYHSLSNSDISLSEEILDFNYLSNSALSKVTIFIKRLLCLSAPGIKGHTVPYFLANSLCLPMNPVAYLIDLI